MASKVSILLVVGIILLFFVGVLFYVGAATYPSSYQVPSGYYVATVTYASTTVTGLLQSTASNAVTSSTTSNPVVTSTTTSSVSSSSYVPSCALYNYYYGTSYGNPADCASFIRLILLPGKPILVSFDLLAGTPNSGFVDGRVILILLVALILLSSNQSVQDFIRGHKS